MTATNDPDVSTVTELLALPAECLLLSMRPGFGPAYVLTYDAGDGQISYELVGPQIGSVPAEELVEEFGPFELLRRPLPGNRPIPEGWARAGGCWSTSVSFGPENGPVRIRVNGLPVWQGHVDADGTLITEETVGAGEALTLKQVSAQPGDDPSAGSQRRTKRRYAHELYPHNGEFDPPRPLSVDVPYQYARFVGLDVTGTGWFDIEPRTLAGARIAEFIDVARIALLADALAQGMTGDEAWAWADERVTDDMEVAWERAYAVLGDDVVRSIKPYPCGPEPDHHSHYGAPDAHGWQVVSRVQGRESDCLECTEPIDHRRDSEASR